VCAVRFSFFNGAAGIPRKTWHSCDSAVRLFFFEGSIVFFGVGSLLLLNFMLVLVVLIRSRSTDRSARYVPTQEY
jgi:hypothetical protein